MILGYINQFFFTPKVATEKNRDVSFKINIQHTKKNRFENILISPQGYVALYNRFESFYSRYVFRRIRDCWSRPVISVPGAEVTFKDWRTNDYGWSFE